MRFHILSLEWLLFILYSTSVIASEFNLPRLSPIGDDEKFQNGPQISYNSLPKDLQTFYYTQILDHFNYRPESYTTFKQRYAVNFNYWAGANQSAPILAYFGAESPLDSELAVVGFLNDNAAQFNALLIYIEHRFYGKSIPFGSREEALRNASSLGYLNSAQALADYASILLHVKNALHAKHSPVIVIGGSYGGMLASWFRLKYSHIALGALASSAPILYFDHITPQIGYYSIATKDFREASENCYETIKKSWSEIDRVASKLNGLSTLSTKFKTCSPLKNATELRDYLWTMYATAAQYNHPPRYPVTVVCRGIDGASVGDDILGKIAAGVVTYKENSACYVNEPQNVSETTVGWGWQRCSEMVMPVSTGNDTMFPAFLFNMSNFIEDCKESYGVRPRPHWVTTYYGGHDIRLILHRFGSNIIFSNGLRDPYSSGGVLDNISDTIIALRTVNGSHCLDIHGAAETDPKWLVKQRKTEVKIIKAWITRYYADLLKFKN